MPRGQLENRRGRLVLKRCQARRGDCRFGRYTSREPGTVFEMQRANEIAVISVALLLSYYETYRWVPLGWWNGEFHWPVQNDQFFADIVIGLLLSWMIWSFWQQRITGMWIGASLLALWIGVHLSDWWIPYVRGTGEERAGFYRFYSSRTQILPVIGSHHPPDGGHAILDLFVLCALISSVTAAFASSRKKRRSLGPVVPAEWL